MFEYTYPHCGAELEGSFGENVYCEKCNKTYETDYDTIEDGYGAWLTGAEFDGKIDID